MILKKLLTIVLFFALVSPLALKNYLIIHYVQNIEIITQKFCVNKNKPELHCNGKCYLAKEFKMFGQSIVKQNTDQNKTIPQLFQVDLRFAQLSAFDFIQHNTLLFINKKTGFHYSKSTLKGFLQSFYTPPQRLF